MDREIWWAAVHGFTKSWTQLSTFIFFHSFKNILYCLFKSYAKENTLIVFLLLFMNCLFHSAKVCILSLYPQEYLLRIFFIVGLLIFFSVLVVLVFLFLLCTLVTKILFFSSEKFSSNYFSGHSFCFHSLGFLLIKKTVGSTGSVSTFSSSSTYLSFCTLSSLILFS